MYIYSFLGFACWDFGILIHSITLCLIYDLLLFMQIILASLLTLSVKRNSSLITLVMVPYNLLIMRMYARMYHVCCILDHVASNKQWTKLKNVIRSPYSFPLHRICGSGRFVYRYLISYVYSFLLHPSLMFELLFSSLRSCLTRCCCLLWVLL